MIKSTPSRYVWGWPWHGRVEQGAGANNAGMPADTPKLGQSNGLFRDGDGQAWLLDMGSPVPVLTQAEEDEAVAKGWSWRSYAFVSGGYVYGKSIHTNVGVRRDSCIYMDEAGVPWLVRLSLSKAGNNVSVTAQIVRFGLFEWGAGAHVPFSVSLPAPIACADLSAVTYDPVNWWTIEDVWTNGRKILVSVFNRPPAQLRGNYVSCKDIYSLLEITLSGVGPGGVQIAGAEVRGGAAQTTHTVSGSPGTPFIPSVDAGTVDVCETESRPMGINFHPQVGFVDGRDVSYVYARFAHYKSDGTPVLIRVRWHETADSIITGSGVISEVTEPPTPGSTMCGTRLYTIHATGEMHVVTKVELLEDDTSVSHIGTDTTSSATTYATYSAICSRLLPTEPCVVYTYGFGSYWYEVGGGSGGPTGLWAGMDYTGCWPLTNYEYDYLALSFRTITSPSYDYGHRIASYIMTDGSQSRVVVGISYSPSNMHFMAARGWADANFTVGQAITPVGVIAPPVASTPLSGLASYYFAWNRKSGSHAFATKPTCYV